MNLKILVILLSLFFCLTANNCCVSSDANAISKKLKTMEKEIPLPYHKDLIKYVELNEKKPLPELFFTYEHFFETELKGRDIPLELKYLPISLSAMQPDYQHEDRCGIWALPTLVGLRYGLVIDERHDERFSIESSTKAALDYLTDLYGKYDDWWPAILAYSNSPVSLQHAMSQTNESLDLWDFYEQNLVPNPEIIRDFIANLFIYHDHQAAATVPQQPQYAEIEFTQPISLALLAQHTDLSVDQIKAMNPVYRSEVLVPLKGYPLLLPMGLEKRFPTFAQELYDHTVMEEPVQKEESVQVAQEEQPSTKEVTQTKEKTIKYKVKKGDNLTIIAKKYQVTVSDIVEWNHLESDLILDGQELIIKK